jgi:amino acid adenylation domain-containing protein
VLNKVIEGFPLSPQQKHLWSLQATDHGLAYRAQCAILIEGPLDFEILRSSVHEVFARNEILRTTFHCLPEATVPIQTIADPAPISIARRDLSDCGLRDQAAAIEALFREAGELRFDFASGPQSYLSLVCFSNVAHVLFVNLPSLFADGVSLNNLVHEISASYSSYSSCDEDAEQPLQYADVAEWQNELLGSPEGARGRDYWHKQIGSDSRILRLAFEDGIHGEGSFVPNILTIATNYDLAAEIEALTRRYRISASAFLLSCWQNLLWLLTGQSEFSIGVSCEGRAYEGLQRAFGLFSKSLPIGVFIQEDLRFSELIERVEESLREAQELQEYFSWEAPLVSVAEGSHPFCDVAFEFESRPAKESGGSPTFAICRQYVCSDRFKLKLACVEQAGHIRAELHYDSDLFRPADVDRFGAQFLTLLRSAIANPEKTVNELEILDEGERERLLLEFSGTNSTYSEGLCIHQLFEKQVERTPDLVALAFGNEHLTYAQVNKRANQVANYLRALGVGPEVPVAICMDRCLEMVVGLIGILKAGGAYLPLDPAYPKERLAFMLEDAGTSLLLTSGHLNDRIPKQNVRAVCLDDDWESIAGVSSENPLNRTATSNLAYVIYTSGSTGQPKGVMVEHQGLTNTIRWLSDTLRITSADSTLLKTPITFDAAGREIYPTLLAGARLIIAEPTSHRDCRYVAEELRDNKISILHSVPSFLRLLIEEPAFAGAVVLRAVMCGGEVLTPDTVKRFGQRSSAQLYNVYGPTEAIIDSTYWLNDRTSNEATVPIGKPIPNARVYLLDATLRPVPIGVAGELYIGGVSLARGYLNRPDLTAERFIPNPFANGAGARLYKTGDLARYLPDGNIQYLGRTDYQVKIRGVRIELGEIEAAVAQNPSVRQAIVTIHECDSGEQRLVSYVVAQPTCDLTAVDLRGFLRDKLPEHMVPAAFVLLESFPLTPNGKIDRRALQAPAQAHLKWHKGFVAFRNPTEELLTSVWAHLLGVERIGIHDNFFDLGGHSLLATQMMSRIREAFEVEIPLRRLFEAPTVAGLAESIDLAQQAGHACHEPPLEPVSRDGHLPLSFAQQRIWFIDQLDPKTSVYNFPVAVRLKGSLNLEALERSLNEIVRRHEALRTTFSIVDGQPSQVIAPTLIVALPVVSLRGRSEVDREKELQRLIIEEARRPFDLARGPILRAGIVQLDEDEHVGLLTMHHIASDGWSIGVLIREMAALYQAFCSGGPSPLPELTIQYADFAYWQRERLQGPAMQTQLDYWKQQLSGSPPLLELPTDHPRPPVQTFRGAHQSLLLPKPIGRALSAINREEGVTLFMTLLAAFNLLLRCYTSRDDLVVGTPIANRNRVEIEGLIGFFVNTLVLRTNLSGDPTFRELIRRVREVCLSAYVHQDLPFEKLVEELYLDRDLSRNPMFQVMFVLQNGSTQTIDVPGLTVSPVVADGGTTHFDLTLHIADSEQGLFATASYNTDLFDAPTIVRMLEHFKTLLQTIVKRPDQRLSELSLLSDIEPRQVLVESTAIPREPTSGLRIHQLFEAQAELRPDAIAIVFEGEALTYRELNARANQLAHALRQLNVGPEISVAVCLERSFEMVIGLLAVLKAGGVYLPLDLAYPRERKAFMLQDSAASVLLTQNHLKAVLPEHNARVVCLDSDLETISENSEANPANLCQPENLAYIIYTSGSTGQPKGVLISHDSIVSHCRQAQKVYELTPSDRVLQLGSMSFDLSLEQILPTLMVGARIVVAEKVWSGAEFHKNASAFGLTVLNLPTGYWQELAREWSNAGGLALNSQYRLFIVGGELMLPEVLRLWQQTPLRSVRLINAYGPTEATITTTVFETKAPTIEGVVLHRVPIGRPLADREIWILDNDCNPVPIGVPGELHIGGSNLARGYLNQPALTAERFIPNPYGNRAGERLYKTGDLARYLSDGDIEYIGRADHQVKIRGFRIELEEIEAMLAQHGSVQQAIVSTFDDASGGKLLVAYVVGQHGSIPTAGELRSFLMNKLPEYMVPAVFVPLVSFPTMPNGKVDRRALPRLSQKRPDTAKEFVSPRDDLELQLVRIWEEVLNFQPIGITDNFFELGGHSLLAVRLLALIDKRLDKKLPLAALFRGATVEHLANIIHQNLPSAAASSLVPIQSGGTRRPIFLVHPAGGYVFPFLPLAQCLGADQPCYGLQARGVEEGQRPHTRIEEMAACYVEDIRSVQPEGPYLLGGWSMGGEIAFEMAQQLHRQGQKVALLALLDAQVPSPGEILLEEDFEKALLTDVVRYFRTSTEFSESLAHLPKDELVGRILDEGKRASLLPIDVKASDVQRLLDLCKSDFRASRNYVMRHYPGRVTLFKASENLTGTTPDPTLGWGDWADEGVDVQVVPGNHANMVYEPNVAVLAKKLIACIDQVQSELLRLT